MTKFEQRAIARGLVFILGLILTIFAFGEAVIVTPQVTWSTLAEDFWKMAASLAVLAFALYVQRPDSKVGRLFK